MSASCDALISWLLTLVAVDTDIATPFRVVGLQQMLIDGQLALHAAVVPVKQFTTRDLRSRSKVLCVLCVPPIRLKGINQGMDTDVVMGGESFVVLFHVIGLQGQLAIHVAVIPVKRFTTPDIWSRSKVCVIFKFFCLFICFDFKV